MKKLILLLLIPLFSFSQISYKDIMSINSIDKFKRVVIENGYEFNSTNEDGLVIYGYEIVRDSIEGNKSSKWAYYNSNGYGWQISWSRVNKLFGVVNTDSPYDLIVEEIKKKCKYYKILNYNDIDYVSYSCSESSYKGKIGFVVSEGNGIIRHFPKIE